MKLIFFGDCMFGRNGHPFIENPFVNVEHILKQGSVIFFNLETTISRPLLPAKYKEDKAFNYQSTGEQLDSLRKITKKPIFVSMEGGKAKTPLWMTAMFPHKYIYDSVEEIIEMVEAIDSGEKEIDSDRWRLLKPEYR